MPKATLILYREAPAPLALTTTALLYTHPLTLTILLLVLSVWNITTFPNRRNALRLWLFGALFGPISEAIAIHYGAWTYTLPQLFDITLWLAPLWGLAALLFARRSLNHPLDNPPHNTPTP